MNQHTLFLLVGASSSGKTEIAKRLHGRGYSSVQSYTTRPCRNENGIEFGHLFCDMKLLREQHENNNIAAYVRYSGSHYFATKDQLYDADIYVIDPKGRLDLLSKDLNINYVTIYIDVPEEERYKRMLSRGSSIQETEDRIDIDREAFKNVEYDYRIENIDIEETVNRVESIILAGALKDVSFTMN